MLDKDAYIVSLYTEMRLTALLAVSEFS